MKFNLPDAGGGYQEITITEGGKGSTIVTIQSKEDVEGVIEKNKRALTSDRQYMGKGTQTSMYKLGELSALKAHQLMKDGTFWDDKALRKWFADLDNYLWRCTNKTRSTRAV